MITQELLETIKKRLLTIGHTDDRKTGITFFIKIPTNGFAFDQVLSTTWDLFQEATVEGDILRFPIQKYGPYGSSEDVSYRGFTIEGVTSINIDLIVDEDDYDSWVIGSDHVIHEGFLNASVNAELEFSSFIAERQIEGD